METEETKQNQTAAHAKTASVSDMTVGSPLRQITKFALPLILGYIRLSGNLVGISINLCKSIQKELFINDTP